MQEVAIEHAAPRTDDLDTLDNALEDGAVAGATRRRLLQRAAAGTVAGGALGLVGAAPAFAAESRTKVAGVIATSEVFGVTFLTEAIRRSPGTPSAQFVGILKAANTAEFDHIAGLRKVGGKPATKRFWIPDAVFGGGGIGLFQSIEAIENIELSNYLNGVTVFAKAGDSASTRILAAALGVEAEHRTLARSAQGMLGGPQVPPDNRSFEARPIKTAAGAQRALEALGIGFGKKGSKAGRFYNFPGSPLKTGTGFPQQTSRSAR